MATFETREQLRDVLGAFVERLAADPAIADRLVASGSVLRFRYTDPSDVLTIDLRRAPIRWTFGDESLASDVEMIQSADTAHAFWLGRLSAPRALATRKVVARGAIPKALALLPALSDTPRIYREVLASKGIADAARPAGPRASALGRLREAGRELLGRFGRLGRAARAGGRGPARDGRARCGHYVPLVTDPERAPGAPPPRPQALPEDPAALGRHMLERMLLIRAFEQRLSEAWARGDVPTEAIHLSIGQEATAVGVCFALRADDTIATTHRGHGHMLAKGADLDGMMAELLGKETGLCRGKGGSMHVTDASVGAIGANGIVGASVLLAAGAAHAARLSGGDEVAVAFLGDGATNQGMFHEALNFAAVLDLPCVFVVENNLYGEFTPLARHCRVERLADRAAGYGLRGVTVDGNDVRAVHRAALEAASRARRGEGATLLECLTYRWHGHMEGESVDYRPAAELAAWKARCPIAALRTLLVAEGTLTEVEAGALEEAARARVATAYERARGAAEPPPESLTQDVFAPDAAALYAPSSEGPARGPQRTYAQAIHEALAHELERDPRVYLLGEDVTTGGYFAVTAGLSERFGVERIIDTPISEYAIVGSAVGAAMRGARPVVEILFSDFLTTCMDPLVNQAAKLRYMSGGQYAVPLVVRTPGGAGLGMAAQHSQSLEALLAGVPGLILVAPATPADAKGLLSAAIRSNNPVVVFENKVLYAETGPVPQGEHVVPLGVARVARPGRDVTAVTVGGVLGRALEAAERLAERGIELEVVDVRTLVPLDLPTIVASVARTGRLVTIEDAPLCHGFGAEIVARVSEAAHASLRSAPRRVAGLEVPIPYASGLENLAIPTAESIAEAVAQSLDEPRPTISARGRGRRAPAPADARGPA